MSFFNPDGDTLKNAELSEKLKEEARLAQLIGWKYYKGEDLTKDDAQALYWFRIAAEHGNAVGQFNLGVMYNNGEGVPKDSAEATQWWRKAAEQGYASAQSNLGSMYRDGNGVPKDDVEAVKWFRKAAEQGHASAQFSLGQMYANIPKDAAEAAKWFRKAAEQGHALSQAVLGYIYHRGIGITEDLVQAHVWTNIWGWGANEYEDAAKTNLAIIEKEMTSEQKAEAMKLARELFAKLPKGK